MNFFLHLEQLSDVKLIADRDSGRPRGFGFVEIEENEPDAAINGLDGKDFDGRTLKVNEARERNR